MKKLLKIGKIIFFVCISIIFLGIGAVFIYHNYQLRVESKLINNEGELVNFNNKNVNVYNEGSGKDTFVFMAGSGIAAPVYELKGLYSKFSKENKISVIERAGYGYSDVFHDDRDIDKILEQTRKALIRSGNKPPYILVPHSLSGIEAIYWAQKYPSEVKGIIALDIGLPNQYVTHKIDEVDSLRIKGMNILTKIGFQRLVPSITYNPEVIQQSFLTEQEKNIYKALSYKQAFNDDMKQELLQSYNNSNKSNSLSLPKETPILFIDAIARENKNSKYTKQKNRDYEEFASKLLIADVKKIESTHSIYLHAPDEIYKLATDFINNKVVKN
ncbi:pimeloyl-ACP methyl ester carboxylesterase [Bacillus sp. RC145]|uniref:alpha/beta fold hydrolase n=1 Tax=Bacillus TaxID=1386 RepID=UPI0037FE8567